MITGEHFICEDCGDYGSHVHWGDFVKLGETTALCEECLMQMEYEQQRAEDLASYYAGRF